MANQGTQAWSFADAKGRVGRVQMWVTYGNLTDAATKVTALDGAIIGLSNGNAYRSGGVVGSFDGPPGYGATAVYEDAEDKAVMTFQDAMGAIHRYSIPAPKQAIFLADGETVNPANALVTAFTGAMTAASGTAFVSSRSQIALTVFLGGFRQKRRMQRRLNIRVLAPGLGAGNVAE